MRSDSVRIRSAPTLSWATVLVAGAALLAVATPIVATSPAPYDPLRVDGPAPRTIELTIEDAERQRSIPLRLYQPAATVPPSTAPVVLFSHGLHESRDDYRYLGEHWAKRGFVVVFLQHAGGDEGAAKESETPKRGSAVREAANQKSFVERAEDVRTTLDTLERWQAEPGHPLAGRLDTARLGVSGHSFGALTTQAVSGQQGAAGQDFFDPRVRAAVAMSPSPPQRKGFAKADPDLAFGSVRIPWLLLTGTEDNSPIDGVEPAERLKIFPALPPGAKYELVLDGAKHWAFGDRPLSAEEGARDPDHHRAILALTTAFWDAYLRNDRPALAWLVGAGPRTVLDPKDRWQRK